MISSRIKYVVIVIVVLALVWLIFGNTYKKPVPTGNALNDRYISGLHPAIQHDVSVFAVMSEKAGIPFRITSGFRTLAHQAQLDSEKGDYAAAPGRSFHNYGLAVDVSVKKLSGAKLKQLVGIAKSLGFEWGGDWTTIYEPWHFQKRFGNTIDQLQTKYKNGTTSNGWVKL